MQAGWDWARSTHSVAVTDERGRLVASWRLAHSEEELAASLQRLAGLCPTAEQPVGNEARTGLIVDRLLASGHPVVAVHPNAFHAARPRWGASSAKSDAGDAIKLAEFVRTELDAEHAAVRRLVPTMAATVQLRTSCRTRGDVHAARLTAASQLDALLTAHWPGPCGVFDRLDSPIGLAFLDRYPPPASAARLTAARIDAFLRRNSYSGKKPPGELLARLRQAPTPAGCLDESTLAGLVGAHVNQLRALLAILKELNNTIAAGVADHPYAALFATLPRIGNSMIIRSRPQSGGHDCAECPRQREPKDRGRYIRPGARHEAMFSEHLTRFHPSPLTPVPTSLGRMSA